MMRHPPPECSSVSVQNLHATHPHPIPILFKWNMVKEYGGKLGVERLAPRVKADLLGLLYESEVAFHVQNSSLEERWS